MVLVLGRRLRSRQARPPHKFNFPPLYFDKIEPLSPFKAGGFVFGLNKGVLFKFEPRHIAVPP